MKKIFFLLLFIPFIAAAQDAAPDTTANRIYISEDDKECVDQIADNNMAIKYLIQSLVADKDRLNNLRQDIMNDPAMRNIMREMRGMMQGNTQGMNNNPMQNNTDTQQSTDDSDGTQRQ